MTYNPGHLVMELDRTNVIQMSVQSEQTASTLRSDICQDEWILVAQMSRNKHVSDIVVPSRHQQRPTRMKSNTSINTWLQWL